MDASAADYTDLSVSLIRQEDQDRALVGIDLHGEFLPFAELKLAAVDEMLAAASDRQALAQREQAQQPPVEQDQQEQPPAEQQPGQPPEPQQPPQP